MSELTISHNQATAIIKSLPIGVLLANSDGVIEYANPKAEDIFGFSSGELSGLIVEQLMPNNNRDAHVKLRTSYVANPTTIAMGGGRVLPGIRKNGVAISLQIGIAPLADRYMLISIIESTNEVIKPSVSNDPLTGLPNRKSFNEHAERLHKLAIRNKKSISIAFLDLDNFKSVNDQYGHHIGDLVICDVANLLRNNLRGSDIVARVGGDEFIICIYDIAEMANLKKFLNQLITLITSLPNVDGNLIEIGASIGATFTLNPEKTPINDMANLADALMYKVKNAGKGFVIAEKIDERLGSE